MASLRWPPIIIALDIVLLYSICSFIIFPALNQDTIVTQAQIWLIRLSALFAMISLAQAALSNPGYITKGWTPTGDLNEIEAIRSGPRKMHRQDYSERLRFCAECSSFKPPRAHHCSTCKRCVLRYDHHCSWTDNCVGITTHKPFFLLLFYGTLGSSYALVGLTWRLVATDLERLPFFPWLIGILLSCCTLIGCIIMLLQHIVLMVENTTSVEVKEAAWLRMDFPDLAAWAYRKSSFSNLAEVLGANPLLWLVPTFPGALAIEKGYEYPPLVPKR